MCRALDGKSLYSALYETYTVTLHELQALTKSSCSKPFLTTAPATAITATNGNADVDGFREQWRRKRNSSGEEESQKKRAVPQTSVERNAEFKPVTRNYFAPLRQADMDCVEPDGDDTQNQQQTLFPAGRLPPIVLTTSTNLMQLQKEIKGLVKGNFEFRSTCNGTQVVIRDMADYYSIGTHFDKNKLSFFTFHPKGNNPIKAVIRHLPIYTPANDISDGLQDLGFGYSHQVILPLFLITLAKNQKSQEILRLTNLCHIDIRVEVYRAQNALTQCYNCQDFGHVWSNCRGARGSVVG
jgi:hypothetical protein